MTNYQIKVCRVAHLCWMLANFSCSFVRFVIISFFIYNMRGPRAGQLCTLFLWMRSWIFFFTILRVDTFMVFLYLKCSFSHLLLLMWWASRPNNKRTSRIIENIIFSLTCYALKGRDELYTHVLPSFYICYFYELIYNQRLYTKYYLSFLKDNSSLAA